MERSGYRTAGERRNTLLTTNKLALGNSLSQAEESFSESSVTMATKSPGVGSQFPSLGFSFKCTFVETLANYIAPNY